MTDKPDGGPAPARLTADEIAAMQAIKSFPPPKLTDRIVWQPCHDWNGGRGLPGSPEALLMTCNQCCQTVTSPSHFGDAKPCVMRLAPNSWLGISPARFAVEHLQNELATERQAVEIARLNEYALALEAELKARTAAHPVTVEMLALLKRAADRIDMLNYWDHAHDEVNDNSDDVSDEIRAALEPITLPYGVLPAKLPPNTAIFYPNPAVQYKNLRMGATEAERIDAFTHPIDTPDVAQAARVLADALDASQDCEGWLDRLSEIISDTSMGGAETTAALRAIADGGVE